MNWNFLFIVSSSSYIVAQSTLECPIDIYRNRMYCGRIPAGIYMTYTGPLRGGQGGGQIARGPRAPRGLITSNASRSGGLIK